MIILISVVGDPLRCNNVFNFANYVLLFFFLPEDDWHCCRAKVVSELRFVMIFATYIFTASRKTLLGTGRIAAAFVVSLTNCSALHLQPRGGAGFVWDFNDEKNCGKTVEKKSWSSSNLLMMMEMRVEGVNACVRAYVRECLCVCVCVCVCDLELKYCEFSFYYSPPL